MDLHHESQLFPKSKENIKVKNIVKYLIQTHW